VETTERILFNSLLESVRDQLRENHPEVRMQIKQWKGEEIALLREELQQKTKGTISEKWFYTHIKNEQDKLPRKDTLNLFCEYINEQSWNSYVHKYAGKQPQVKTSNSSIQNNVNSEKRRHKFTYPIIVISVIIVLGLVGYLTSFRSTETQYRFCFIDQNTHLPVVDSFLEIKIIKGEETPLFYPLKSNCIDGVGNEIEFVIKGRYYKALHIKRTINNDGYEESIFLQPDDYAMILHLFANSKVDDWEKRRDQLREIMNDNLKAYELTKDGFTIDVLTKSEFINKMTLPTRILKKVAIVQTDYEDDKISLIKFTQE